MKIAEIERDLSGHVDKRVVIWIQRLQEQLSAQEQATTECAKLLVSVVDALNQLRDVNIKLNAKVGKLDPNHGMEGMVSSVIPGADNDD